jgi:putative addiction module component (TIGR02574 family)
VIVASDIKTMSLAERLRAMELLWQSISAEPEKLASPAWHGKVLASRLAKVDAGKGTFLTVRQLKARLAKKRP